MLYLKKFNKTMVCKKHGFTKKEGLRAVVDSLLELNQLEKKRCYPSDLHLNGNFCFLEQRYRVALLWE